jgi:hypothetical protein
MRSARGSACCAFALLSMPEREERGRKRERERERERDEKGGEGIEKINIGQGKEED